MGFLRYRTMPVKNLILKFIEEPITEELKLEDFNKTKVSILWGYFNAGKKVRITCYLHIVKESEN